MKPRLTVLVALAATAATLGACSDKKPASKSSLPPTALPVPQPTTPGQPLIGPTTRQLVTAVVDTWTSTHATLQRWERQADGSWKAADVPWPAVIGKAGSAWGAGLHGIGAVGREGPVKKEGDNRSPAGAFAIRDAYGYAKAPPRGARIEYTSTDRGDLECVDDPASDHYAKIVDRKQVPGDWESAEQLLRDDGLYAWVVDVAHNPERSPGKGSCIFLHVWGGPESTTAGCTAMAEPELVGLIRALDPAAKPVFVLLPRADYQALAAAWGLPALTP